MRKFFVAFFILILILACQVIPTPPALRATPHAQATEAGVSSPTVFTTPTPDIPITPTNSPGPIVSAGDLAPFPYQGHLPFAEVGLTEWSGERLSNYLPFELPVEIKDVHNAQVADGLTLRQRNQLLQDGFVILHSQEAQFSEIRQRVASSYGQPYLLTSDSAYHALKISLDELSTALEGEELHRRLQSVVQATLTQVASYLPLTAGSDLEAETRLAAAYLGVGLRLLDPQVALDPELELLVRPQVEQIMAGGGQQEVWLFPGLQQDFQRYQPSGHYSSSPNLSSYFRGKTWLEEVYFTSEQSGPRADTAHIAQIITLALRQAKTETGPTADEWSRIVECLNFISGTRNGGGPPEYAILMDKAYGSRANILSLQDSTKREMFSTLLRDLPFPQIDPGLTLETSGESGQKSWSFLGARYALDEQILQALSSSLPDAQDAPQLLPGGLELMAVLGAPAAFKAMKQSGVEFRWETEQITSLQSKVLGQTEQQWQATTRNFWLEQFRNHLTVPVSADPTNGSFQKSSDRWEIKELNSVLGGWADLQFESSAFVLPGLANTIPDPNPVQLVSPPAPGYVEPNPQVFYQLARLASIYAEGLRQRDLMGVFRTTSESDNLSNLLIEIYDLADRLQRLGDIAAKELRGEKLAHEDFAIIQAPLGPGEKRIVNSLETGSGNLLELPPVAGIAAFDYSGDRLLQIGIGKIDRIYMLVPLEGGISIAQGGVYSYYEFSLPRGRQIDAESWRWMLANDPPQPPGWVEGFYLLEGTPIDVLAYRIGDRYRILPAAGALGLHGDAGRDARIVQITRPGEILQIMEGPIRANGLTWWKFSLESRPDEAIEGWINENQAWFERVAD